MRTGRNVNVDKEAGAPDAYATAPDVVSSWVKKTRLNAVGNAVGSVHV